MNAKVDAYIARSDKWPEEMAALRQILLRAGLTEDLKWAKPCYAHEGHNIAIIQEMNDFLALMFFKGALLDDPHGMLHEQGPNSRSAKRMEFTSVAAIKRAKATITTYVQAAIDAERRGLAVGPAPELELADALAQRVDTDAAFRAAFQALTPGRRREYHLFVAGAKQAATRVARVDKCAPRILAGKGLRDP